MKLKKKHNVVKTEVETPKTPEKRDIRDIMDTKKLFTMFYSGVENDAYFKGCYDMGIRDFLMSYQYVQNRNMQQYSELGISLFIDSGAFTYMQDPKYLEYTTEDWEKQIVKYLKWAEKHKNVLFAIANLDLDYLVGAQKVREWNEKYFEPFMLKTGLPVCFVYHPENNDKDWEFYCKRYPYVGISNASDNNDDLLPYFKKALHTAEKYNTLVHGFGMTRTGILPQLPFYTVDSTSWKSGFRYGQIAIWNGKKVQLKGKEDFDTKVFPVFRTYKDITLDEQKIRDYYEPEVLRANVYAYMKSEAYIRDCLKALAYWTRPKSQKRKSLDGIKFPSAEWIKTVAPNSPEVYDYAQELNVSMEDAQDGFNCIVDVTCFMNWDNPEYSEFIENTYSSEVIKEIHDRFINRITENDEEKVSDLQEFFKLNLLGEDTTLLYLNTTFDRIVKERDHYVEEEDYDLVDVPSMDLDNAMHKYLPAITEGEVAPEISELDDEIFSQEGIIAVRDGHGRFLKGQKKIHKPKKLYSEKYPKLSCDMCINAQRCPEYKAGYVCAYNKMFSRYNTRDMGDIIQAMQGIVDLSMQRLQRSMLTEIMQGGMPDPNVSNLMNQSMNMLKQLQQMYEYGSQEVLRQTKVVRADGSSETTTQVSNPQQGGILAQIFGNMSSDEPTSEGDTKDMKEVAPEEEEPKKSDS